MIHLGVPFILSGLIILFLGLIVWAAATSKTVPKQPERIAGLTAILLGVAMVIFGIFWGCITTGW